MVRSEILKRRDEISTTPILERIAGMKESLAAAGDEAQECRHLPAWASKQMADQGIYRYALPLELGGENLTARQQIEVIEAVSAIDGSVGWCTQISSEINALVIRQMDEELATKIFNDWGVLVCSGHGPANGPNPGRHANRDGEGWRLNYQGSFASGCHNANWNYLMGAMTVDDSSVNFDLRFWITDPKNGLTDVTSDVLLGIWNGLKEHGIEIPFPQRGIHVRTDVNDETSLPKP